MSYNAAIAINNKGKFYNYFWQIQAIRTFNSIIKITKISCSDNYNKQSQKQKSNHDQRTIQTFGINLENNWLLNGGS